MAKAKDIIATRDFCKRIEREWSWDFLPKAMLEEMGCNMQHVMTLARMGEIRLAS